jgi:hypothetical protein
VQKYKKGMFIFNFIFIFAWISSSLIGVIDSSGWVALERPSRPVEEERGEEKVWVVFSKEMEREKFIIRFPDDPDYRYLPEGIEMRAAKGKESFHLYVQNNPSSSTVQTRLEAIQAIPDLVWVKTENVSADTLDLLYQIEGKWVWERLFTTPHHVYILQTLGDSASSERHRFFVDSLHVNSRF